MSDKSVTLSVGLAVIGGGISGVGAVAHGEDTATPIMRAEQIINTAKPSFKVAPREDMRSFDVNPAGQNYGMSRSSGKRIVRSYPAMVDAKTVNCDSAVEAYKMQLADLIEKDGMRKSDTRADMMSEVEEKRYSKALFPRFAKWRETRRIKHERRMAEKAAQEKMQQASLFEQVEINRRGRLVTVSRQS